MPKLVESSPCFLVKDVVAASSYYVDKLGFTLPRLWGEPPVFAMPHRDGYVVMLNQVDRLTPQPNGGVGVWDAYFWCTGVDELFEEVRAAGATIVYEPCNQRRVRNA